MTIIVSIHSFRGGTGKSNLTANLAGLLAKAGKRVGVIDTDIQSPGIHVILGLEDTERIKYSLNDYLWEKCSIDEAAYDVTTHIGDGLSGKVYMIPSSIQAGEIARALKDGYEVRRLHQGIKDISESLSLDYLLIDTHPGLNEETLLSFALSNVVLIVMRPDRQDYQGTSVTVKVANRLKVRRMAIVVNKAPTELDFGQLQKEVESAYNCAVAAILPHSSTMMMLGSEGIFSLRYPDHDLSRRYQQIADYVSS
jgi:MinD-like ATPase involved in chromosome partitioning or flagellar assembly